MQVKELIELLKKSYKPHEELYVEYWDKNTVEQYMWSGDESPFLTNEEWAQVVESMENSERLDQSMAADSLVGEAESVMAEREDR